MLTQLLIFIVPVTLLTITPGVDTLVVIRNTGRGGWRDGVVSSFGICCGLFVHALVSAVGISLILLQSAVAFHLLKLIGAGYLIWLGLVSLRSALGRQGEFTVTKSFAGDFQVRRSFLEGLLSNVLNPKTIVFYMAFLPQFIDPTKPAIQQLLLLAALHFVIAMIYQSFLAIMVEQLSLWLRKPQVRQGLDGLTGTLMLFFGLKLAIEQ